MKPLPPYRLVAPLVASALLAALATIPNAQGADALAPMALRGVMARLGTDMQAVTGAISVEDWAQVARLAPQIASHAEPPPAEKARIIGWLGANAAKFRGFDQAVHEAAHEMGAAAAREDGPAVIAQFAKVQQGCLDCHRNFRKPFIEQFYGKN